jgi:hydrogenase maturation protein HypF
MHGQVATIRLARGLAPLPLDLRVFKNDTPILAVGGHQKVAIALCNGRQSVLGPHLGDMETVASRKRFIEHVDDWRALYRTSPSVIVHDLHPDYFTTRWAQEQASEKRVRIIAVQHHHAHVVSGMVDKGWLDRTVLGIAWDGTGLGQDGTIWGGEALLATACRFERVASLRPFVLPGGEAAVRNPWRIAYALLHQTRQVSDARLPHYRNALMESMLASAAHAPLTTSMGRLFDGIAAIILAHGMNQAQLTLREESVQYEAQFAAELEAVCDCDETGGYEMPLVSQRDASDRSRLHWDWRPMVQAICVDKQQGVEPPVLAMRFHRTLARAISELVLRFADYDVVLSGGVFQNRILVELIGQRLDAARCNVAWPGRVPVNDGGLAAGQLAVAMAILERETCA